MKTLELVKRADLKNSFFKSEKLASGITEVYFRFNLNVNDEPAFYEFKKSVNLDELRNDANKQGVKVTPCLPYKTHAKIEVNGFKCFVDCHDAYIKSALLAMKYCDIIK